MKEYTLTAKEFDILAGTIAAMLSGEHKGYGIPLPEFCQITIIRGGPVVIQYEKNKEKKEGEQCDGNGQS